MGSYLLKSVDAFILSKDGILNIQKITFNPFNNLITSKDLIFLEMINKMRTHNLVFPPISQRILKIFLTCLLSH